VHLSSITAENLVVRPSIVDDAGRRGDTGR
jgi:hypothetical protein